MGKFRAVLAIFVMASALVITGCQQQSKQVKKDKDMYDNPDKAIEFEIERTKDPATGRVPWNKLWEAIQATEQMKAARRNAPYSIELLNWIERGPNADVVGPSNGNTRANNGITAGRVRAVMVDSIDPTKKTVWVGGIDGGLWKTTDITTAPANWVLINDFFANLAVSSICQDPRVGFQNIMYFCTGESFSNADAVRGIGVFKSTDGGATWNYLSNTSSYINGTRIVCDAAGNVYLGTRNTGLLRSTNGGTSWTDITPSGIGASVCDLEISSTGRLHVATGIFSTSGYRFTDNPAAGSPTWVAATTPFTTFNQRTEFAVSGNVLYACPDNSSHQVPTIWKSTDGGVNWASTGGQPASGWASGQGWYSLSVGINPGNPDECIVGGLDCHKTTTGGNSWTRISFWVGLSGQYVHADQHSVQWWEGGNKLLFGCDGGVHYSTDGGTTIRDRNQGLRVKQFYSVAVHPTTTNYFLGGTQDNGTHQLTQPGLGSSVEVTGGDGMYVAIDQDEPQFQFGSYVYNNYRRSTNGGASWSSINFGNTGRFVNPFDYDNLNDRFYACDAAGVYRYWSNPQTGSTSTLTSVPSFAGGQVSAVHVSPYTANRVYFGTGSGRVVQVDNADQSTPTDVNITGAGMTGYVNCVVTGSSDQFLLACMTNYGINNVWVSINGGTTWTAIDGNLPDMPVRWALFHPDDNTKAYIATETGVWETEQINGSSTSWSPSTSFPTVRTDMIKYRPSDRTIGAGTHGRGIWSTTIPPPSGFDFDTPAPATATCPAPASMSITLGTISFGGFTNQITLSASGNPGGTSVTFGTNPVVPGNSSIVTLNGTNTLAPGNYIITITGTASGAPTKTRDLTYTINPGTPPTITTHPSSQTVCAPAGVTFTTAATGATGYQWQISTDGGSNYSNISGATATTYTIASTTGAMNNNRYRAIVNSICGTATSNAAILTVNTAPSIGTQPSSQSVCAGSNATFSVTATGSSLTYQWEVSVGGGPFGPIGGATASSYTVNNATTGMSGNQYRVVVNGSCTPTATSNAATLTVVASATVSANPSSVTICEPGNTSFTVGATGATVYQWQVSTNGGGSWSNVSNGGVYSGATTTTLSLTGATAALSGNMYRAQVSNATCTTPASSAGATLTVNTPPAISSQPSNATICAGSNQTFNANATGTSLTYQWQLSTDGGANYSDITGATSSSYTVTNAPASASGNRYRVVVSGTCTPAVTSSGAILTVHTPITITTQPSATAVCATGSTSISIAATGTGVSYQWQIWNGTSWVNISNNATYSGATTANLTINNITAAMNGTRYRNVVSGTAPCGPVTSNETTLNVTPQPVIQVNGPTSLLPGRTVTLSVPSVPGVTYQWFLNGTAIPGANSNSIQANVMQLGNYHVVVTAGVNSCISAIQNIKDSASTRLFVYPSPNDGRFTVSYYNNGGGNTQRTITVFDSKGSKVYHEKFNISGPYTLMNVDLRPAQTGIYYVVLGDLAGNRLAEEKVMVR